ncbi:MAG: alkaline phosphatase [Opitutaceae bacterium]|nr:alkaline phosphatase [Opitutaceae bacterium]
MKISTWVSTCVLFCLSLALALNVAAAPSFTPLPLGGGATTAFADKHPDDRKGGWLDLGGNDLSVIKSGRLKISGISFDILDDEATGGKSCIVLGGPNRPYLPARAEIPVDGKQGAMLYLLHAAAWCPPAKAKPVTGLLFVDYADGSTTEWRVRFGRDVADWAKPDAYKNAIRVWTAYNANTQVSLFASKFKLDAKPVKSVRFEARESAWMVVAATLGDDVKIAGIKPNLNLDKTYAAPTLGKPPAAFDANAIPKNVILIIGDGMGPGALQLTSLYQHKAEGRLVMEQLPVDTRCVTVSLGPSVTDSAAAATAFATGIKTKNSRLGMTEDKKAVVSIAEAASRQKGKSVAIITSDGITDATPAGFYAHVSARNYHEEIAVFAATSGYDILIGGVKGKPWFFGKDTADGKREDGRNLINEMASAGYACIENQAAFDQAPAGKRVVGFMPQGTLDSETCLADLEKTALGRLSRNDKGFFMMLECAITDKGGHGNNPELSVRGTLQVDWAVKAALEFAEARGDTLVMVTADHETGALSARISADGKLLISYATTSHTDIPVRFLAYGPGSGRFDRPLIDNTDVGRTIASLWDLDIY